MKSDTPEKRWEKMDQSIEEIRSLVEKKKRLIGMLRKAEKERGTVSEKIFAKVKAEYEQQLEAVRGALTPMEKGAYEAKDELAAELRRLKESTKAATDDMAEVEFRFKVGEYDEQTFSLKQAPLKKSLDDIEKRRDDLTGALKRIEAVCDALSGNTVEPEDENTAAPTGQPLPQEKKETVGVRNRTAFENPIDWLKDFETDETVQSRPKGTSEDPLASLRGPFSEEADESSFSKRMSEVHDFETENPVKNTPFLTIKTGGNSERKIPVLPTTLTIGREHDNNIELKDEEVSRYHARIVHKKGRYILESLEGSRATWVNGKNVTESELKSGDKIKIGKTEMSFS
jgi:hypothetical protein